MNLEQQLQAALSPCEPGPAPLAAVMAQVSAGSKSAGGKRRGHGRSILFVSMLVLAAAAAMLTARSMHPSQHTATFTPAAAAASEPDPLHARVELPAPPEVERQAHGEESQPNEFTVKPFVVQVLPFPNEDTDAVRRNAVASMYAAFVDRLRAVPGLTLVESTSTANAPETPPNYRITIGADRVVADNKFTVRMRAETRRDGSWFGNFDSFTIGDTASRCAGSSTFFCNSPEGVATNFVDTLRKKVFPPDPSLWREMQARLLDKSLDERQRLRALTDLASFGQVHSDDETSRATRKSPLREAAIIRSAVDFATNATDPTIRAQAWGALRGTGNADLIAPLTTALSHDSDGEVRLAVVGTLAGEFGDDLRVRAALQSAAQHDARPLVRALAQRILGGLSGDMAWKEYILASLEDSSRPDIERIEALFYQMGLPTVTAGTEMSSSSPQGALQMLDSEAIHALTDALPRAAAGSSIVKQTAPRLVMELGRIEDPAITEMLLASLKDGNQWLDKGSAIQALGALPSRRADPRVRAVFEDGSADDSSSSPQAMVAAASVQPFTLRLPVDPNVTLKAPGGSTASTDSTPTPPRLGVILGVVQSGSYIPRELVGKSLITSVTDGSVGQKAGLKAGDILLEINGTQIPAPTDATKVLDGVARGVDVDVVVHRFGETVNLKARF